MRRAILLTMAIVGLLVPNTVQTMAQNVGGQTSRYLQGGTGTPRPAPNQQPQVSGYQSQTPAQQPTGVYDQRQPGQPVGRGGSMPTQPSYGNRGINPAPTRQNMTGPMDLLGLPQVLQELQLNAKQSQQIGALRNQFRQSVAVVQSVAGMQLTPQQTQILQTYQQAIQNAGPQLEQVLSLAQMARLQQLDLQNQGVRALGDPAVARRLGLSTQQQAQVAQVAQLAQAARQRHQQQATQGVATPETAEAIEQTSMNQVMSILSEDQRRAYQQLTGKPVKLAKANTPIDTQPASNQASPHGQGENSGNRYGYQGAQQGQGFNRGQAGMQHGQAGTQPHGQGKSSGNRYGYQGAQQGQGLNRGQAGTQHGQAGTQPHGQGKSSGNRYGYQGAQRGQGLNRGQADTRHDQSADGSQRIDQGGSASRSNSPTKGRSPSRGRSGR